MADVRLLLVAARARVAAGQLEQAVELVWTARLALEVEVGHEGAIVPAHDPIARLVAVARHGRDPHFRPQMLRLAALSVEALEAVPPGETDVTRHLLRGVRLNPGAN